MSAGNTDPQTQLQGLWKITQLGDVSLISDATLTLEFSASDVSGFTGCNTVSARAVFGPHSFRFDNIRSTKKLCDSRTMERETDLMDKMTKTDLFVMNPGDVLSFHDESNQFLFSAQRQ